MAVSDVDTGDVRVGPPPPFDVELAAALEMFGALLPQPMTPAVIRELRERMAGIVVSDEQLARGGAFTVETVSLPVGLGGQGGFELPLVVCRPTSTRTPAAAVYFMHGGGMVIGDARTGVSEALEWAEELGLVVVSPDYRLAPENPHPTPVDDCYAGLLWTADRLAEFGVAPGRTIVAGTSAGGGLAAAVALMARDRGGPALAGQMLLCPMLDDRNDTPSAWQMAGRGVWDRASNETGWTALLGDQRGGPDVSPYAAPARAGDLSGLPPAFIDVGSAETFRDEDVTYASRIWQAGGAAELHVWPGGFHGFDLMAPQAPVSQAAKAARTNWLRRLLAP
ncbi:esterase [Frankia sp. CcI49]|uniref:alpha/beta hydrolase n=1 Tax=Frankia sp. CcI49 TaxID=1745382 RepID=UPI000975A250|nr:alpha/beta hydrolase [Frankia sp. CcI49]ONH58194.1 esterase [Frankia sp. CcI49]